MIPIEIEFEPRWFQSGFYVYVITVQHKNKGRYFYIGQTGDRSHIAARSPFYRLMGHFNTYGVNQKGTDAQLIKYLKEKDLIETHHKSLRVNVETSIANGTVGITAKYFKINDISLNKDEHTFRRKNIEDIETCLIQKFRQTYPDKIFNNPHKIGNNRTINNEDAESCAETIFKQF